MPVRDIAFEPCKYRVVLRYRFLAGLQWHTPARKSCVRKCQERMQFGASSAHLCSVWPSFGVFAGFSSHLTGALQRPSSLRMRAVNGVWWGS